MRLAERLDGACRYLPTFGQSRQDGTPHIEVGDAYFFVTCERGSEFERRRTTDIDELLFWVFSTVTFSMSSDWEVRNRLAGEDSRRQLFAKQIQLLANLSADWAEREDAEHGRILAEYPFRT